MPDRLGAIWGPSWAILGLSRPFWGCLRELWAQILSPSGAQFGLTRCEQVVSKINEKPNQKICVCKVAGRTDLAKQSFGDPISDVEAINDAVPKQFGCNGQIKSA